MFLGSAPTQLNGLLCGADFKRGSRSVMHKELESPINQKLSDNDIVETLNQLITVCLDGVAGYEVAAEAAERERNRVMFQAYAGERRVYAEHLSRFVSQYHGERSPKNMWPANCIRPGWGYALRFRKAIMPFWRSVPVGTVTRSPNIMMRWQSICPKRSTMSCRNSIVRLARLRQR